jgi:hypothetical protein
MFRLRLPGLFLSLALALGACGGGDGGTNPPPPPPPPPPPAPVASVVVTPPQATILIGATTQLSAQPRDAGGNGLSRAVVWSSNGPAASVSATGLVTGVSAGSATVTATSEGVVGTASITVSAPVPVVVNQVDPAVLVEGQTATITGTGFSAQPGENIVTIDGSPATVTQASITQLQVTVPATLCRPKGTAVPVRVSVGSQQSNGIQQPVNPAQLLNLAVGQQVIARTPGDRCLQFDAAAGTERYVIGVQSVSETASTLTALSISGDIPGGAIAAPALATITEAPGPTGVALSPEELRRMARWQRHLEVTAAEYERERPLLQHLAGPRGPLTAPPIAQAASVPATVQEGQTLQVRVPLFGTGNTCANFVTISAKVRKISAKAILLEDEGNPLVLAQGVYDQAGADFDPIHAIDEDAFGPVGDFDLNQRLVVVVTKEVNKAANPPLAFVSHGQLLPTTQCASSNEGEYFFLRSADPAGQFPAGVYTATDLAGDLPTLLVHEFAHNIQGARRRAVGGQFMASWMAEGLATAAQEVAGFSLLGLQDGQNYGPNRVYSTHGADPRRFFGYANDLLAYWGFNFAGGHIAGAPETCTWVGAPGGAGSNPGPCASAGRIVYGVPWSLIKHTIDRRLGGPANQKQVLRAFSEYAGPSGFAELEAVLGQSIATLMAEWAPVLYLDDRYPAATQFQLANWNLRTIAAAWQTPNAELIPRIRGFADFSDEVALRAGSSAYYEVSGAQRPATALRVRSPAGDAAPAGIQVWVVRVQ